jgi:UDP-N-acetylglucosamine 2-epimerase (non-hydrolysing)
MDNPPVVGTRGFGLLTLHRTENVDHRAILDGIIRGILSLEKDIIFPAHPRTVSKLNEYGLMPLISESPHLKILEPQGYLQFLSLLSRCDFVLTDSGGIQEEVTSPLLNKTAFVLRDSTERPEAVESGHVLVVGTEGNEFPEKIIEWLKSDTNTAVRKCPYGNGDSAKQILDVLERAE